MFLRIGDTWARFKAEVQKRALPFLALYIGTLFVQARLTNMADWVVAKMTASGLLADAIRGLIGPLGLLSLVLLVLLIHAYWDTRPSRLALRSPAVPEPFDTLQRAVGAASQDVLREAQPTAPKTQPTEAEIKERAAEGSASSALVPPPPMSQPPAAGRSFISIDPNYIFGLFQSVTGAQAETLVGDYFGKWTKIGGQVVDVRTMPLYPENVLVWIDGARMMLTFRGDWALRAKLLHRGSKIKAVGCIERIDELTIALDQCELVTPRSTPHTPPAPSQ